MAALCSVSVLEFAAMCAAAAAVAAAVFDDAFLGHTALSDALLGALSLYSCVPEAHERSDTDESAVAAAATRAMFACI